MPNTALFVYVTNKQNDMKQLKFRERAILIALTKRFEGGVIDCPLRTIANEIGGITYQTISNYFRKFAECGLLTIANKGTHRQIVYLDMETIKNVLNEVCI